MVNVTMVCLYVNFLYLSSEKGKRQLSGYAYNEQTFPFNLIVRKIYEKSGGYSKNRVTHYNIPYR
jgi:hypothetical protein